MLQSKKIAGDIRFWIALFFLIRLIGITNPPLEVAHNWRQTTVTMPARNFLETNANIFYPRLDIAGEKTGITGMEFPLLNYIIYLQSLIFGYEDWYGRLINLVVSSIGLFFFFKLIRKFFESKIAFHATLILLFSIWFAYSRKIMPDTFSMSLTITGLYFGSNYLDRGQHWKDLLLYFLLMLAGILSKLPSAYIGCVFLFFLYDKKITLRTKTIFVTVSMLILTIVSVYYFYWVPYLTTTFGFSHFFMGENLLQGTRDILAHIPETLHRFYSSSLHYGGFILFLAGLIMAFRQNNKKLIWQFSICFASFLFLVVLKSGFAFYHHIYYIIPFAPVMALVAAHCLSLFKSKTISIIALLVVGVECIATEFTDFRVKHRYSALLNLEADLDTLSDRKDLILINSGDYPTPMYFSHRKGWVAANDKIAGNGYISDLKTKGLKYIVILKKVFGQDLPLSFNRVLSNEHYDIYKL